MATVPLLAVGYLIGGVTISQVLGGVALVAFTGVVVACTSAGISAFCSRVQAATVLSFGAVIALTVGTLLVYTAAALIDASRGTDAADPPEWLLYPNPFVMVADVVGGDALGFSRASSPFGPIHDWLARDEGDVLAGTGAGLGGDVAVELDELGNPRVVPRTSSSFWFVSAGVLGALAAGAVAAGARRLRTPAAVER